jgi:acetoin utilization deacetylase AcuC-like enzyme
LSPRDFYLNGKMLAELRIPALFVQEGGYRNRFLGINARSFFKGFYDEYVMDKEIQMKNHMTYIDLVNHNNQQKTI